MTKNHVLGLITMRSSHKTEAGTMNCSGKADGVDCCGEADGWTAVERWKLVGPRNWTLDVGMVQLAVG